MSRMLLAFASLFLAGSVGAATQPAIGLFDPRALAGWSPLQESETVPYLEEGLRSELLFAARSPAGSYAFVTRIDNTLGRDAVGPEEIQAYFSQDTYQDLAPTGFSSEIVAVGEKLRALVVSFRTTNLHYDVGAASGSALLKTVFLPLVVRESQAQRYFNWIYVANFRGSPARQEDLQAFDRFWLQAKLSDPNLSRVELERFNALRPELAAATPTNSTPLEPLREREASAPQAPAAEDLAQALLAALTQSSAGSPTVALRRFTSDHPDTALAQVFRFLEQAQLSALQETVWKQAWQSAPAEQRAWLGALFLAQSIASEEGQLAARVTHDAAAAGVSAGELGCDKLGALLDLMLPKSGHPLLAKPQIRQFFRLDKARGCADLSPLLRERGLPLPRLEELAIAKRSGAWELRASTPSSHLPLLAVQDNSIVLVKRAAGGRGTAVEVEEVSNLVEVLGALGPRSEAIPVR